MTNKTANWDEVVTFDPDAYIRSLMESMGFNEATDEQKDSMYQELNEQVKRLVLNAVSLYVEPEEMDEALMSADLNDIAKFVRRLVDISPEAQLAIVETLERFYAETVENCKKFI